MERFVLIMGTSYCGSTMLAMLLGNHPHIATVGEMTGLMGREDLGSYQCSCGNLLRECGFWKRTRAEMRAAGIALELDDFRTGYRALGKGVLDRLQFSNLRSNLLEDLRDSLFRRSPRHRNHQDGITHRNVALVEAILHASGKRIFIDTSKNPNRVKPLQRALGNRLRVIHLIRDGRDVVTSTIKHQNTLTEPEATRKWKALNERADRVLRYVPQENRRLLRYEDLVDDPRSTLEQLCLFIGVAFDESCLELDPTGLHVIGNTGARTRGRRSIERPVTAPRTGFFGEGGGFESLAGDLNRKYGYY